MSEENYGASGGGVMKNVWLGGGVSIGPVDESEVQCIHCPGRGWPTSWAGTASCWLYDFHNERAVHKFVTGTLSCSEVGVMSGLCLDPLMGGGG